MIFIENLFNQLNAWNNWLNCDSYFCYKWNLWLSLLTVNSIDWMIYLVNWNSDNYAVLKLIWLYKGVGTIILPTLRFLKNALLRIPWEKKHPFCANTFDIDFQTRNLKERESWSILEWGSWNFGSGPKLSLLHLIFSHFVICSM